MKGNKNAALKICGCVILAAFVCGRVYSFVKSDFKMWMTRAFTNGNIPRIEQQINPNNPKIMHKQGGHPSQPITAAGIAKVFFMTLSMLVLVSTVTAFIELPFTKTQKQLE